MDAASDHAASASRDLGRTKPMGSTTPATSCGPPADSVVAPKVGQPGILERLLERGRRFGEPGPRYQVDGMLGVGGGGRVFAVSDRNLDRGVAMKVISIAGDDSGVRHVLDEARITASLSHPNVLPVYELDLTDDGEIYYTMKRIEGLSLSAALDEGRPLSSNELVRVLIGVTQALAYAHHRGIVHQDVKPDNIMLGEFGEVLLVDWGSAARLGAPDRRIYGTPLYMSPEQARVESVDARSDVYGLGATMFHALVGRIPTWADTPERFWERKRLGELDPPTVEERRRVPAALLAIALKALAPRPEERYQDAEEIVRDLDHFQAGLAVSAYAEPRLARLLRWHRRHWRGLWLTLAVASIIVALGALLYGERIKELAHWGSPILVEDFDQGWESRWIAYRGGVERRGDGVVTTSPNETLLMCERQFSGPIAVEYEAEFTGKRIGDISLEWWRPDYDRVQAARGTARLKGACCLLVGAWDGTACQIETDDDVVSFAYFTPERGHRYRIRGEIEGDRVTLLVDGRRVCDYRTTLPSSGGYFALRGYFPGQAFSHVRVYARGVPERLPATAVADWLVDQGRLDQAATEYQRVADDHPGGAVGDEATFRRGLCDFWQGRTEQAIADWRPLRAQRVWDERVRLRLLDQLRADGSPDLLPEMERLYREGSAEIRHGLALQWTRYVAPLWVGVDRARKSQREARERIVPYLELHDRLFADDPITDKVAAHALIATGRQNEVLRRYPRLRYECVLALLALGRPDRIQREYPDQIDWHHAVLLSTGRFDELDRAEGDPWALFKQARFDEIPKRFPEARNSYAAGLIVEGRMDEALAAAPKDEGIAARVKTMTGHADEVAAVDLNVQRQTAMALRHGEEALEICGPDDPVRRWPRALLGLQAWIQGDRARAEDLLAAGDWPEGYQEWEYVALLGPFLHGLDGDWSGLDASCRTLETEFKDMEDQRESHFARFLLGEIDQRGFREQPYRVFMEARLRRARGMRAERLGHREEALAAYRAYLATPLWERSDRVDPVWDLFVEWRVAQLAAALPASRAP
jgi:hypothetical protein